MPSYIATISVTLRKSILDPQGKAVHHALQSLDLRTIDDVRMGKFIEMKLEATDKKEAEQIAERACKQLLANPVMENYSFKIEAL